MECKVTEHRQTKEEYLSKFTKGWAAIIRNKIETCGCGKSWKERGDYCHNSLCDSGMMTLGYYR